MKEGNPDINWEETKMVYILFLRGKKLKKFQYCHQGKEIKEKSIFPSRYCVESQPQTYPF